MRRTRHALGAVAREVAIEKGGPVPEKSEAGPPLPLDKSIYISVELVGEHPIDFAMPFCLAYTAGGEAMLKKYVRDSSDLWDGIVDALPICSVGATIGTHAGPGAIAVAYFSQE